MLGRIVNRFGDLVKTFRPDYRTKPHRQLSKPLESSNWSKMRTWFDFVTLFCRARRIASREAAEMKVEEHLNAAHEIEIVVDLLARFLGRQVVKGIGRHDLRRYLVVVTRRVLRPYRRY